MAAAISARTILPPHWVFTNDPHSEPGWFQVYLGLEAEAASIHEYDAELVPGLLQTADYYRAFMRTAPAAGDEEPIERKIAVRAARQSFIGELKVGEFDL